MLYEKSDSITNMSLLNYTTQIEVEKTIGEIQKMLGKHGAQKTMMDYEDNVVSALSFALIVNDKMMGFRLPCDWRPVLTLMKNDTKVPRRLCDQTQAVRVAWRIVKDWVEAQMALIDTAMVKTQDVFLPYTVMADGRTLAENVQDGKFLLGNGN